MEQFRWILSIVVWIRFIWVMLQKVNAIEFTATSETLKDWDSWRWRRHYFQPIATETLTLFNILFQFRIRQPKNKFREFVQQNS